VEVWAFIKVKPDIPQQSGGVWHGFFIENNFYKGHNILPAVMPG